MKLPSQKPLLVDPERRLQIGPDIDEESFKEFSAALYQLETDDPKKPVVIELNSPGGDAYSALAFASRLRLSPCETTVVVYGLAASAAVLILAYGKKRYMTKESWVMVHEDSGKLTGNVVELERESVQMRRLEVQWANLLADRTKLHEEDWELLHKRTTYMTPEACLKAGLVDKII